jgi:hypothetical protein
MVLSPSDKWGLRGEFVVLSNPSTGRLAICDKKSSEEKHLAKKCGQKIPTKSG